MTKSNTKPASNRSALLGGRTRLGQRESSLHRTLRRGVNGTFVLLWILFVGSVTGCSGNLPTRKPDSPHYPTKPALTEPLPSVRYSTAARDDIQTWRSELTTTSTTSKP